MIAPMQPLLTVRSLAKEFGGRPVLAGVDLTVPRGSLVSVLGRSGAGKSVLLKCLAGIVEPDAGEIAFAGRRLGATTADRAEFRRRTSYLFQGNALFDSLTARDNVALPLVLTTRIAPAEIERRSLEALRRLGLADFASHHPGQLSGGMQKRLALARALVTAPELVLFDEPTAGLDPLGRNAVFEMIARYRREFGFTAVVVTHDVSEALAASDRVALLEGGVMRLEGAPREFLAATDPRVSALRDSHDALLARLAEIEAGKNPVVSYAS
jgi:phospholipid/cholesterol/gamma-HCH transport system ATP-binding protein